MTNPIQKPKLVFFQYEYDNKLPEFLLIHTREHVKCLSTFFEVTVINEDCDYQRICDKYEPDLVLFESGVNHETCRRPKIENVRSCPHIPKLALHNADGFCNARAGFLSDMDHLGIDTFFSISVTAAEHTPEIDQNLFVWPTFIDPDIYRDYGCWKSIPVLFTGNRNQLYPWRQKILKAIIGNYPSLISYHPGYEPRAKAEYLLVGEDYARTINSSWFVPTCGTVAKEVVRKHFEIPGCKACLITERSAGLISAGFADMDNCVFADEHNVADKIEYLFHNPNVLNKVINSGYLLAHSHHTIEHRDQILQWFKLKAKLKPNQRIVQTSPFEPLRIVEERCGLRTSHIISGGFHLKLLREGDELLLRQRYDEAERCYLRCINYMRWMPEPRLRMALCELYKGNARAALSWIDEPINFILSKYKAIDPDPVEWAYFVITLLCLGKEEDAAEQAKEFPWLIHPELNRARSVVNALRNNVGSQPPASGRRYSIHKLPDRSSDEWIGEICIMLRACGQFSIANRIQASRNGVVNQSPSNKKATNRHYCRIGHRGVPLLKYRDTVRRLGRSLKRSCASILHGLEGKYGYFLPYGLSESRDDEFFAAIQAVSRGEDITAALIVGAALGRYSTAAVLTGAIENANAPTVFCISSSTIRPFTTKAGVKWYRLGSTVTEELYNMVKEIKEENRIKCFDLILVSEAIQLGFLDEELQMARFVMIEDTISLRNSQRYDMLRRNARYTLVACNPELRDGYAIFVREGNRLRMPLLPVGQ
jgi:hypothetical protein